MVLANILVTDGRIACSVCVYVILCVCVCVCQEKDEKVDMLHEREEK